MAKKVVRRRASDNRYLHKDFHGAMSAGIEYLYKQYGEEAVRQYLRSFTRKFYAPLIKEIKNRGLMALKRHFEKIYAIESGKIKIEFSKDELILRVAACPAVMHMRKQKHHVARLFYETTKTVNEVLCEGTPFRAQLAMYDEKTGRSVQRFYRRRP